jgi:hypothetical protein
MGWLRDYLWFNSSQLINGYSPLGVTKNAVWDWMFLFGHLIWATGFMFLISWRGYWQELIESIVWAHEQTPLANLIIWAEKPVALSIVQARFVGWFSQVGLADTSLPGYWCLMHYHSWRRFCQSRNFKQVLHGTYLGTAALRYSWSSGSLLTHPQAGHQWPSLVGLVDGMYDQWEEQAFYLIGDMSTLKESV